MTWQLMVAPSFYLPESYVNGTLEIEEGDLRQLLTILMTSLPEDRDAMVAWVSAHRHELWQAFYANAREPYVAGGH